MKLSVVIVYLFYFVNLQIIPIDSDQQGTSSPSILTLSSGNQKSFNSEQEKVYRQQVKANNTRQIEEHNSNSNKTYTKGQNEFIDLKVNEFASIYLTLLPSNNLTLSFAKSLAEPILTTGFQNDEPIVGSAPPSSFSSAFVSPFSSGIRTIPSKKQPPSQGDVLLYAKQFLKQRGISEQKIDQQIIPKYKLKETAEKNQSEQEQPRAILTQSNSLRRLQEFQLSVSNFDVDWTCISGQIRKQGKCGACYAFAPLESFGSILSIYFYTFFVQLSPQEIVDCSKNSLTFGCLGGFLEGSLSYMQVHGVGSEYNYPYTYENSVESDDICLKKGAPGKDNFKIQRFVKVSEGNCFQLKQQLQHHPIAVGIAGYRLMFYRQGVFTECDQTVNHAVLLVGYRTKKTLVESYWIIKNTWGTRWGENGYARISQGNDCGVCKIAHYPVPKIDKGIFDVSVKKKRCSLVG